MHFLITTGSLKKEQGLIAGGSNSFKAEMVG